MTHASPTRRSSDLLCPRRSRQFAHRSSPFVAAFQGQLTIIAAAFPRAAAPLSAVHRPRGFVKGTHDDEAFRTRRFCQHVSGNHRSAEHTSELQSLMRISYAVFCLKKKNTII